MAEKKTDSEISFLTPFISRQKDCSFKNHVQKEERNRVNLTLAPLALNVSRELFASHIIMFFIDFLHLCCWFIAHEKAVYQCRGKMEPTLSQDNEEGV